jgi:hypothetical protein
MSTIWKPKVHGERSAYGWETSTIGTNSRVRIDATVNDLDLTMPTTIESHVSTASITPIDIGVIIQTLISTAASREWAIPTVHFEDSASGWDDVTSTVHAESSATSWEGTTSEAVHWESSASGWEQTGRQDLSPQSTRYRTVEVTNDPWTKDLRPSQTIPPAGPQITSVPSKTITEFPPPPAITHDGVTIRPIAVTRQTTVTLSDGLITMNEQVEFEVAVGSLTLSMGNPVTTNNVIFEVTTDTAGSTVLHAGDLTTTLPQPTAGEARTITDDTQEQLSIATAVISGTTKYILAGQTLAPGQPVTIGGTPISITTSGGGTVLYVGDRTTTLSAAGDMQTLTDWATISAGTRGTAAYTQPVSAVPTSKKSDSAATRRLDASLIYFLKGITIFAFAL